MADGTSPDSKVIAAEVEGGVQKGGGSDLHPRLLCAGALHHCADAERRVGGAHGEHPEGHQCHRGTAIGHQEVEGRRMIEIVLGRSWRQGCVRWSV